MVIYEIYHSRWMLSEEVRFQGIYQLKKIKKSEDDQGIKSEVVGLLHHSPLTVIYALDIIIIQLPNNIITSLPPH